MTQEVLKKMYQLLLTEPHAPTACDKLEKIAREALAQPEPSEKFCDANCVWTDHHPDCRLTQPEQEPVAWQLWVGADTPLNAPMGWQFYSTYDSLKNAEISARTINSYQQAPFAKIVPLYTTPPQRTWVGLTDKERQDIALEVPIDAVLITEAKLKEKNT